MEFIEFKRVADIESANDLISTLEKNNIQFELEDKGLRFELNSTVDPIDQQYIIKIKESDFEKADSLFRSENSEPFVDHYLYTFSDSDLIDIIINPTDWTVKEQNLAESIIKQRGIVITAEIIKNKRKAPEKVELNIAPAPTKRYGYGWLFAIGLLSIVNTIAVANNYNSHFTMGLGFSQILDGFFYKLFNGFTPAGIVISSLFSSLFFLFWYFAKQKQRWAFISGLIIYGLDMVMCLFLRDWFSLGIHVFVFSIILMGYMSMVKKIY
jgi:hypothetical protein